MKSFKQFLSENRLRFKLEKEPATRTKRGIFVPGYDKSLGKSAKWKFVVFTRYTLPSGKEIVNKSFSTTLDGMKKEVENMNTPLKQRDGEHRSFFNAIQRHKNASIKFYEIKDENI
jgi:hypothetical protein